MASKSLRIPRTLLSRAMAWVTSPSVRTISVAVLLHLLTDGLTLDIDLGESVLELCNGAVHKSSRVDIPI